VQNVSFGSLCCGGSPADGFSFNLVPKATVLSNPGYGQPAEEGLGEGLAINFDTWDNGDAEGPAIEVKWLGQLVARTPFQPSQSPAGVMTAAAAVRNVVIDLKSDGKLNLSYGGLPIFQNLQTPYSPNVIGTPEWVLGARNGLANDNHWIRDLNITVTPPSIPELFNTGVGNNGFPLPEDSADPHYQLVAGGAMVGTPLAATASGGFPIGPWLADNTDSGWIAPTPSTDGFPTSYYLYQTTFDLKGLDPSMAAIYGWVSADDFIADIFINGISTGRSSASGPGPFTYWQAFSIAGGFQPGPNTITFLVFNSGLLANNPTGLRVQMSGSAWSKPQLKLDIQYSRSVTTLSWGSLPHKTYFVEHAGDVAGPWFRDPVSGIFPGNYNAQFNDVHRRFVDPVRFYRVIEAP